MYGKANCRDLARPKAFTLLEIMVVVAILAIVSASAVLAVRQPLADTQHELTVSKLRWLDSLVRGRAERFGQAALEIDAQLGSASVSTGMDRSGRRAVDHRMVVDQPTHIHTVLGHNEKSNEGVYRIVYNRFGRCSSYAIELGDKHSSQWLLVLGLTGQTYNFDDRGKVDAIIAAERNDAD